MRDNFEVGLLVFAALLGSGLFFSVGCSEGARSERLRMQVEAIEHGHAEWIVSPDGSTEFRWLGEVDE